MMEPSSVQPIDVLQGVSQEVLGRIGGLTEAMTVPPGFRNSIHWNVGHLLHVQLAHWYRLP
ncbi:MAG: hypothetical protein ABIW76_00645 [Fibrobacteria bacterium]